MKKTASIFIVLIVICSALAYKADASKKILERLENFTEDFNTSPNSKPLVSFEDYKDLVHTVEKHRIARMIDLETFVKMSHKKDVVILDTRAEDLYKRSHIKGAVNLPFTKFTQQNLMRIIPSLETKILIYCNNNIQNDPINFASKIALPKNSQPLTLALNIPTYINLYGYGYKNVYELNDVIDILKLGTDTSYVQFEGTNFTKQEMLLWMRKR